MAFRPILLLRRREAYLARYVIGRRSSAQRHIAFVFVPLKQIANLPNPLISRSIR